MTFTHALSTNNYGPTKFIVATSVANGTHTTLASAMAAASVGDTIFLRDSVTENITITPGVNIAAWQGASGNTPSITGKITMTAAGTSTISGITLITNSDFFLAVTGSAASIINLRNCYLNCLNNTGISFTAANTSAIIEIDNCSGNLATTGISLFAATSTGSMGFVNTGVVNSGGSTTASTAAATAINATNCSFNFPFSATTTGSFNFNNIVIALTNTTCVTTAGTSANHSIKGGFLLSGTASAVSIGSGTTVTMTGATVSSSNTNAITGAGTLLVGNVTFSGSSSGVTVTTFTGLTEQHGSVMLGQPASIQIFPQTNPTGTGGFSNLQGGTSTNAGSDGGASAINGGTGSGSGGGGQASVVGGTPGATGTGGSVLIATGNGGATSGQPGIFNLQGGAGTGTNTGSRDSFFTNCRGTGTGGTGHIYFQADAQGGTSGSTAHTSVPRFILNGAGTLTSGVATALLTVTLPSGGTGGGTMFYSIDCTNGTDYQCVSGVVAYAFTSKAGTIAGSTSVLGTEAKSLTTGTLTTSWSGNASGQVVVTATSSISPTSLRITFNTSCCAQQATTSL